MFSVSLANVESLLRQSIRNAMTRSALGFTENYVASMVLNLPNTGMNLERREGDKKSGQEDLVGFQHQNRLRYRSLDVLVSYSLIRRIRKRSLLMWLYKRISVSGG